MEIEVKGHSGCDIAIERRGNELVVLKTTSTPSYVPRLVRQALKQQQAALEEYQHIRVPRIIDIRQTDRDCCIEMDYVYSRNFVEYFEQAGFEQIQYLVNGLEMFLEREIAESPMGTVDRRVVDDKFADVCKKTRANAALAGDAQVERLLERSAQAFAALPGKMEMPLGRCHGDLTFSNILFNGNNYYLIDFLDSFIESPLMDVVKLRQDTCFGWSQLMYSRPFDQVRMQMVCDRIDRDLNRYFAVRHGAWYLPLYRPMQLMNLLRVLQYAHEPRVISFLKTGINSLLDHD